MAATVSSAEPVAAAGFFLMLVISPSQNVDDFEGTDNFNLWMTTSREGGSSCVGWQILWVTSVQVAAYLRQRLLQRWEQQRLRRFRQQRVGHVKTCCGFFSRWGFLLVKSVKGFRITRCSRLSSSAATIYVLRCRSCLILRASSSAIMSNQLRLRQSPATEVLGVFTAAVV